MNIEVNFITESFIGLEPVEPIEAEQQPPRSAKFVAEVTWSWGPAHGRSSWYWLCTDRKRSAWYLWEEKSDHDSGKPKFEMVVYGEPYHGIDAKYAAERLILKAWKDEWDLWESPGKGAQVDSFGLLNDQDIKRIEKTAFQEQC